ncbi:fusicoccadiene synthase [Phaeosphaeriaceae sp. PMI808]|nr:fusicoccadiene synthase [Phaeosphaeriaceae sp. PMI808]
MDYQFSRALDVLELHTDGLCEGIPVREHLAADLEEIGTFRAQQDWSRLVAELKDYKGGLGPSHSFMAVSMPECLPDRFELVSYANEFAFLYDDATDIEEQELCDAENADLLEGFRTEAVTARLTNKSPGKRQMQAKILTEMLQLDRERAMVAIKAWATFVEQGCGSKHHTSYKTLAEYLPYRCRDVGHMFWHALVTFGCALTIPDDELDLCSQLVQPAVIAASLTNDVYSYEKEVEAARKAGKDHVTNGLWVLMIEHGISLEEAKVRCRDRIKKEVAEYVQVVERVRIRDGLSSDAKKYVELMQYSVSGNVVWSIQCPRYHKGETYNERQQLRATFGIDKYPMTHALGMKPEPRSQPNICEIHLDETTDELSRASSTVVSEEDEVWDMPDMAQYKTPMKSLSQTVTLEPYDYILSLPSKGVRDMAINALNFWLEVPSKSEHTIKAVINRLHTSSLMLDDLQDGSQLRRGQPSAHVIFGASQTINSATFQFVEALTEVRELSNPICLHIFIDEVKNLFIGQSYDLSWIWEQNCPSLTEYLQMVDGKTGAMFRLLTRLMVAESTRSQETVDLSLLCLLLGRYFQIRDDYQNLVSEEYKSQKGSCEDLDEGKYSLPLIHALRHSPQSHIIRGLLSQRRVANSLTGEQKRLIVRCLTGAGSLEFTLQVLRMLYKELESEIDCLETEFGKPNFQLRLVLGMLKV